MRLVVIGGGAAGFFCAVNAARMDPTLEVIILEKTGRLLSKVRISGGGRCNVTHACFSIPEMSLRYPRGRHFVKKAFYRFFTEDTIAWFRDRGVLLKTEADGRMFPVADDSSVIIDCLMREASMYGVQIKLHSEVRQLEQGEVGWRIRLTNGETLSADRICIATGGYPKTALFDWLKQTGHTIESPVPSLFTFNIPGDGLNALMGIATEARIRVPAAGLEERGAVLITHWGLSGPAVLRLSAWGARALAAVSYRFNIFCNWIPDHHEQSFREKCREYRSHQASQRVAGRNDLAIPHRLWVHLCERSGIDAAIRWADLPAATLHTLVKNVCGMELQVQGKTTFKEEFVTAGGIRLSEIDPATMQSRLLPALFFAGEVMDVDGVTGGFNFQHAWTSGWIAATSITGSQADPAEPAAGSGTESPS